MATVVYCDPDVLGREQRIHKQDILGGESPLEFEDGHALVENDEAADVLVRRVTPIEYGDQSYFDDEDEDGDAGENEGSSGTCEEVITSGDREGEVCGRDRPCGFHD